MQYGLRVRIGPTNRDRLFLADLTRRQADHLGRIGITSKRRQTDQRFKAKGYLRFAFPNRALVRKLEARIQMLGEPAIRTWRFKNKKR